MPVLFFFFLMPSTNVEGGKNAPWWLMIVQSGKWGVCILPGFFFFLFFSSDIYIMMIMKVAERLKRLYWSSSNSTGTHDSWQKGSAEFVSASASSLISAGRRVGLKQQNFKDLEIACSLINICSRSGKWAEIAHQMASSNTAGLQLTLFTNWKSTQFRSWAMTFH